VAQIAAQEKAIEGVIERAIESAVDDSRALHVLDAAGIAVPHESSWGELDPL
jgi:hypothetical protein